jgi:hypothetical protein
MGHIRLPQDWHDLQLLLALRNVYLSRLQMTSESCAVLLCWLENSSLHLTQEEIRNIVQARTIQARPTPCHDENFLVACQYRCGISLGKCEDRIESETQAIANKMLPIGPSGVSTC